MKVDRRDRIDRADVLWEEFRSGYAAARLFAVLLTEFDDIAPNYGSDLRARLNEGIARGEQFEEDDPGGDGPALIPTAGDGDPEMMDLSAAHLLFDQLFPDGERHDARDLQQVTRGMVAVALHSVLEKYAIALGVRDSGSLPQNVAKFLSPQDELPSGLADEFTEFDATRHIVVHNRGVVNNRYVNAVKYNKHLEGHLRSLTVVDVDRYSNVAWRVGRALFAASHRAG
jgi:hypothetical protein